MRKHGGTPSRRDKHVTLAAISPPGVARGRFVGGQQSGLAGCKPPPLFTRGASSCSSQGRRQGEPWGASPRPSASTYLPVVARRLLKTVKKTKMVAIRVGDGRTINSLGGVNVTICLGDKTVTQHCRVLDTDTFDIVIGTDFLRRKPQVKMLSLQRPYSLHCDFGSGLFSVPLELSG